MKTAIILSYEKSLRYKSLYPKCLIEIINNKTLLESQISFLKNNGFDNIYLIGGYRIDRLKNIKDINILYYPQYEKTSEINVLKYAFNMINDLTNLFILSGDTYFLENPKLDFNESFLVHNNKQTGVGFYNNKEYVTRMSFDSNMKWAKAIFLNKDILQDIHKIIKKQYFIIELINDIIDNNFNIKIIDIKCANIETKKDLVKLNDNLSKK